ncbi:MAG TPA: phytanoyl-CoA dioxygenase family protein [Bryobacteraceae bacterium]|nr:phytanoyl-CoA dioxygenase family protein [Bryobacteraceae bacterium]
MSEMTATAQITKEDSITARQAEEFAKYGWILLREALSPAEQALYYPEIRQYVLEVQAAGEGMDALPFKASDNAKAGERSGQGPDGPTNKTAFSLRAAPPLVKEFLTSPRLGEIAARLLGVDAVRIMHFTGIFKTPGSAGTPLHQDLTNLPLDTDRSLTLWIPLVDMGVDMAPMMFALGSHVEGQIEDLWAARSRYPFRQSGPMKAGDISVHMGWTIHGSLANGSANTREAFGISYFADGARIAKRHTKFVDALMANCFAGLETGEPAASPMNPIVYPVA